MSPFHSLNYKALTTLADALETHRLCFPLLALDSFIPASHNDVIIGELSALYESGMRVEQIVYLLRLLAEEKYATEKASEQIDLVWTGQHLASLKSRATSIVIQELFSLAQDYIFICSYALDRGEKGENLFRELAIRMDNIPTLNVVLFLNLNRSLNDARAESILIQEFAETFRKIWRGKRWPTIFFDPRSLSTKKDSRACLHAKCIVIDDQQLFVTSANFTEAAQERNLELGILLKNSVKAKTLRSQLESLIADNVLRKLVLE